jgi:hypothetical protein
MKKIYYIILAAIIIIVSMMLFSTRKFERMEKIAFYEFEDFLDEYNIDSKLFSGPELILGKKDYQIFQWHAIINNKDTLYVRIFVPPKAYKKVIVSLKGVNKTWDYVFNTEPNN